MKSPLKFLKSLTPLALLNPFRARKTPTVIQMEALECGAAALAIILGYYGTFIPLEELRVKCGVSRSGANAYNVMQAARVYGLETAGFKVDCDDIHEVSLPAILHWDFQHFVVLEGIKGEKIYINDPAMGPITISPAEFRRRFSQIAIEMKPGPSFKKQGSPPSLWNAIKERLAPFKDAFLYIAFLQLILILIGFSQPIFIQLFLDKILVESILSWKKEFLVLFFCMISLTVVMGVMQGRFLNSMQIRLGIRYSTEFLWHVLRLPVAFFSQRFGGEIIHRMALNNQVAATLNSEVMLTAINVVLIGVYAVIMYQYDAPITWVGIIAALFNCVLMLSINRVRVNAYARVLQKEAKAYGISLDALQNIETIKLYGSDNFFFSRIAGYYTKHINAIQEIGNKDVWLHTLSSLSQQISNVVLLGLGVWRVMHGNLTVGMLFALQSLLSMFLRPFDQLVGFGAQIQTLRIDLSRLDDVLKNQEDPLVQERVSVDPFLKLQGNLEFKDVTFGYQPLDEPLIKNFHLSIKPGQWVGLAGGVGSGKSTLTKLAASLYAPWSGQVLYDGHEALQLSRGLLMRSLAVVDQAIFLFGGSIKQNLTLWNSAVTDEQIVRAAKDACIHEEILSFPQGYQTQLEEDGRNLSQGQRQRLEIARALTMNPTLLILDEATSAMDSTIEENILKNIRARGVSCLLVAHRLSTIRDCEEILVMEKGEVVERGAHEELVHLQGVYQKLLEVSL